MSREIEIRNRLFNKNQVISFLNEIDVKAFKKIHQTDTYYDNPANSFFKDTEHVNDWIRIREENGALTFNYKHWLPDGAEIRTYCEETEYTMNSRNELRQILKKLNFSGNFIPFITVDKCRQSFMYNDCEISIDEVQGLGDFIEIEYKGTNTATNKIIDFLKKILIEIGAKVGPTDHTGYAYNLLRLKRKHT